MINRNTKHWFFTWETNISQKQLPNKHKLNLFSKISLLKLFEDYFKNVSGLTLQKAHDKDAVFKYVTKSETRVEGPFYCGKKEKFDVKMSMISLLDWQLDLYNYLKSKLNDKNFRGRKVIWLEDFKGNTGKSTLLKWLRIGQKEIISFSC